MKDISYVGEHTWASWLGHGFAVLSIVGAFFALVTYFLAERNNSEAWRRSGRLFFRVHSVAVLAIVGLLFTMLLNHWFEFDYVWKHSNREMPLRYILSCFWEGQEGSFLLWTFWHMVLGNIMLWRWNRGKHSEWEAPVMMVFALVQVFLASMLLGVYVFGERIGSSPFILVRELKENLSMPWTQVSDYLQQIPNFQNGRGLNPLLQNYWMVIHPPTLFLGFGATLIPFAYAIAGLWRNKLKEWMEPALGWTFFGVMVLGTGILMGGAWAYEALSFGGFWAWDPVENASLVPWLTLVAAGHLMMVNKRKETSLFAAFLLTLGTFLLVLYSGFLTRSGVLGDTSVHSFTGDGMKPGLMLFLLTFILLSVVMLVREPSQRKFLGFLSLALLVLGIAVKVKVLAVVVFILLAVVGLVWAYRRFPKAAQEEAVWSREFWLFIGALVLVLSAVQITFTTSVPVFNTLLTPFAKPLAWLAETTGLGFVSDMAQAKLAPPTDAQAHYNKWQVPFAFIVALLVGIGQYLRWKDTDMKRFRKQMLFSLVVAILVTTLLVWLLNYEWRELNLIALLFATVFAVIANAAWIWKGLNGKFTHAGPSVAHVGFALVLLGALISTSKQDEVSRNTGRMVLSFLSKDFNDNTDALLYRGDTVRMGEHFVVYHGKRQDGVNLHYEVDYLEAVPRTYRTGDTVRVNDNVYVCIAEHTAASHFLADPATWRASQDFTRRQLWHAKPYATMAPGKFLFTLDPFVQINPRFGNVAEPSTKHWLHRDLYTHVRYAELEMGANEATDSIHWMPPRHYGRNVGDTLVTPTSVAIIDSVRSVRDSMTMKMLGPEFDVKVAYLRIRDLYDENRWFEARPLLIFRSGQAVAGKGAEIAALRVRFDLERIGPRPPVEDQDPAMFEGDVGLSVSEREFMVMQAIVFPGINVLWIGCLLMFLGTLMAVRKRWAGKPTKA
ncbi:MAG: cytochrome c biogenesis protein CcsA [Flavobacteriales bacterium]|nr:cytochrome c biogenesis protein CcsA [Flavobacteriales bacterium]